jgi:hypothetical protein
VLDKHARNLGMNAAPGAAPQRPPLAVQAANSWTGCTAAQRMFTVDLSRALGRIVRNYFLEGAVFCHKLDDGADDSAADGEGGHRLEARRASADVMSECGRCEQGVSYL